MIDITILISTYRRRDVLLDTLDRLHDLRRHSGRSIEIIVVDNGSPDGTADAVAAIFRQVLLIRLRKNFGACAKNHGLAIAAGELLLFLDDDSYPDAGSIERMCQHFAADPNLGAAVFDVRLPDGSRECSAYPSVFIGCGTGFRRAALREVGGLPNDFFMQAEEYDLSLRLLDAGWTIRRFDDLTVQHRKTPASRIPTRTTRLDARNNLLLISRRFPRRFMLPMAIDWMRRYGWMAAERGGRHQLAFWTGVVQGTVRSLLTIGRRRAVSDDTFETFAGVEQTRNAMTDWAGRGGHRRIVLIDVGKNLWVYWRAARAAGLTIVGVADARLGNRNLRYRGTPVLTDEVAARLQFDAAVVANSSPVQAEARHAQWSAMQNRPVVDLFGTSAERATRAA